MGATAGRVKPDGLLGVAEGIGVPAEADERGGTISAARGAFGAQRRRTVVVPQRLPVSPLLVPLVA